MKDVRKRLNAEVDIVRVENGAYHTILSRKLCLPFSHILYVSRLVCDILLPVSIIYIHFSNLRLMGIIK